MIWDWLSVGLGLGILLLAGDALVKGAVNLSLRLGVPVLIVGLTVVAFGTSAPELLVSVQAVLVDAPALALGNVVGSNTANILLVLGIPALIAAVPVARGTVTRDYLGMMAASAFFIGLALLGPIRWPHALALLAGLGLMLADAFRRARDHRDAAAAALDETLEVARPGMGWARIGLVTGLGLIGLPLGADLLVDGSVGIARGLGVSEAVIGLTLVAVGTSLPELATTVMAALRREAGVALGNVLGSNMFNLLGIIGVAGLVGAIPVPAEMLTRDLWVMLAASGVMAWFVFTGRPIGRLWGLGLIGLYGLYLAALAAGLDLPGAAQLAAGETPLLAARAAAAAAEAWAAAAEVWAAAADRAAALWVALAAAAAEARAALGALAQALGAALRELWQTLSAAARDLWDGLMQLLRAPGAAA